MATVFTTYTPGDRLRDIIDDNSLLLLVISRFSIPFGFGDSTVAEVCRENGVDCATFLAVANLVCGKTVPDAHISLVSLTGYLKKAHTYFLDFNLPQIRKKLIEAVNTADVTDVTFLIIKYFDDYAIEVRRHMEYENEVLFAYISKLLEGEIDESFDLDSYSSTHTDMADKLNELKEIIIGHYRRSGNDILNSFLYDIINCQGDLISHCMVENRLLVPAVREMEQNVRVRHLESAAETVPPAEAHAAAVTDENLSDREKEVIVCVAKGMSNKEIADALCISVNTVTTHRRNIANRLQIHSQAGLTIFAIIHRLIDIKDIRLR